MRTNPYKTFVHSILFWKVTAMAIYVHRTYKKIRMVMTSKGSYIQLLSLQPTRPGNKALYVAFHRDKILYIYIYIYMVTNHELLLLILEHNIDKEILLPTPFVHAHSPFWIKQVIYLLGKWFSDPPPPTFQVILQLQGPVALAISPEKFQKYQF